MNANTAEEVKRLLFELPLAPKQRIPKGTNREGLEAFTRRTGITLSPEFQEWLLLSNAPIVGEGGTYGIKPTSPMSKEFDIEAKYAYYPVWLEKRWVPIAAGGCGNYYLFGTTPLYGPGNPVFYVDTHDDDSTPAYVVASGIWIFLWFLFQSHLSISADEDCWWPFSKDKVLSHDPRLIEYPHLTLPWDS